MKHMKTFLIITLTIFLSVLGCTNNEVEMNRRDYIIENNTFSPNMKSASFITNSLYLLSP